MEAFENLQFGNSDTITRGFTNFKKSPKERINFYYVQTRLENLETQWKSFCEIHREILSGCSREEILASAYTKKNVYEQTEDSYIEYKSLLKEKLSTLVEPKTNTENTNNRNGGNNFVVRLPKITIPLFSGHYSEWPTFKDLFLSLVDKCESLDNVQKLHYLKCHLTGEAEQIVRHIPITASNYSVCWTQLKNRYDNKKYLSNNLLQRLLGMKPLQTESSSGIKELLDTITECLSALSNLGIDISTWDLIVIYIMSQKLDPESRKQWEAKSSELTAELPTLSDFKNFLNHRFRSLEFLDTKPKSRPIKAVHLVTDTQVAIENSVSCKFCKGNHRLLNCKLFANENIESRRNFVQTKRLCFNCFGENHPVFQCKQSSRCRVCKRKHHSLLHPQTILTDSGDSSGAGSSTVAANTATTTASSESEGESETVLSCFSTVESQTLLATALVTVESSSGTEATLRCLLDQGSQASFITESAVQYLGLQKVPAKIEVSGVGGNETESLKSKSVVFIKLRSLHDPTYHVQAKVHVLNNLTSILPSKKVKIVMWPKFKDLRLADPKFNVPNKIDLLLGAELYAQILEDGLIKGPPGCPVAQNTRLGWILFGKIHSELDESSEKRQSNTILSMHCQVDENELLRKFWELESEPLVSFNQKILTEEEQRCEEIFVKTTTRDDLGRYVVQLPFRNEDPKCKYGNSENIALKRLHFLDRRLAKNEVLRNEYSAVIKEYIDLNHMELVPECYKKMDDAIYLPHHAVVREDKTTTKVRVVFDASCQGSNGVSLNQDLMVGPILQPELRHLMMRWRLHPICLVADIVKMYRQVKVAREHVDFQRILWHDGTGELKHYRMLRVTFGTASAPYLAVKALQQLAHDEGESLQAASKRVLSDFYVDDLMSGCETIKEGQEVYEQMNEIMKRGGFQLQKWGSNSKELMEKIGEIGQSEWEDNVEIGKEKDGVVKVLGLNWNNKNDNFIYSVQLPPIFSPVTKRKVVSDISRLYDPLGWIAPVIITAKMFIQKMWISGIDWDQELPPHLLREWLTYREEMLKLTSFTIPRWIQTNQNDKVLELHGFSDASNDAYAGVVYARVVKDNGDVIVNLVASKTKVSPIKQVSIPRLELCGAVLLAKLLTEVTVTLSVPKNCIFAWTDSTVVLAWLSSHPSRWKPFVANRVSEIITHCDRSHWSHVRSRDNPADCASRGVKPSELEDTNLWKNGPEWLHNKVISYDSQPNDDQDMWYTNLEQKAKVCSLTTTNASDSIIDRFSSLRKLTRVIAWCRRLYSSHSVSKTTWLHSKELQEALKICIKKCQKSILISDLMDKRGKYASLSPYKDESGIWRVGGRLQVSDMSEERKHPVLVPRQSHLAKLIIADAHERTLHGGSQMMVNFIRSKFWILNVKNLVRSCVHNCVICKRHSSSTVHPIMGQLPSARVTPSRPFRQTGVDYAGPIAVRTTKGRGHRSTKGYICLFVCMSTRAIHLDVVSDLTSEAFLASFKRFVARRGHCSDLWSDNATTFVGAERELNELFHEEKSSVAVEIADWFATNGTTWHRIPPYSPNFGGLWEAGVKSTKGHLKRVVGNSTLTFEELSTVLAQIEACLNSRPLSRMTESTDDPSPLTPGHFLIGEPLILLPDVNYENSNISCLKRWQFTQRMVQCFWKRWSREYLTQFFHRYKWKEMTAEPNVGDVVLVKEDGLPPARWLYGLITAKHPGTDGVTRVVSLRCKGHEIKRSVSKICVLPIMN